MLEAGAGIVSRDQTRGDIRKSGRDSPLLDASMPFLRNGIKLLTARAASGQVLLECGAKEPFGPEAGLSTRVTRTTGSHDFSGGCSFERTLSRLNSLITDGMGPATRAMHDEYRGVARASVSEDGPPRYPTARSRFSR